MAKNNNSSRNISKSEEYYKLNTNAVDRLVNAEKNASKSQNVNLKDPAKRYRSNLLDRIPDPVKALFIKFWFNGAVCYFILWGIGFADFLDELLVMSVVLGMVTDILVNNILRFVETVPGSNNKWMMFPKKKYWTFIANILYAGIIYLCVGNLYGLFNAFGVEPILFGLFYMMFDLLFIGMKNLMKTIINDAKNKVNKQ